MPPESEYTPSSCFARRKHFVTRRIASETVIVPIGRGAQDLQPVLTLNEVGAEIWGMIDGELTLDEVAETIAQGYEVSADQALTDATQFLSELDAAEMVTRVRK